MKNVRLLLLAFMLLASVTDKAIAQALTPSGQSHPTRFPQTATGSAWYDFQGGTYSDGPIYYGSEAVTVRKYTIAGIFPLVVDAANYGNDTLNLLSTNYGTGQIIRVITTAAANDTLTITHDHNFNGATATYLLSPATSASYKHATIYVDAGGNYWLL